MELGRNNIKLNFWSPYSILFYIQWLKSVDWKLRSDWYFINRLINMSTSLFLYSPSVPYPTSTFSLWKWVGRSTKSTCLSFSHWLVVKQFGKCPFCVRSNSIVIQSVYFFLHSTKSSDLWVDTELPPLDNTSHLKKPNTE